MADVEIEVVDDIPVVADDPVVIEADDTADALAELRGQLERERQARTDAEKRAAEQAAAAHRAQVEAQDSNLSLVTNAVETLKQSSGMLKRQFAEAMAAQDFEAAAEIQDNMSANAARMLQLENGRTALEAAPKPEEPKPYVNADPVEALASQLSPRSAAWVRSHPEYATDPKLYNRMLAAHNLAVSDDIRADSDDYFDAIETTLRIRQPEAAPRRSAPPAAPVTRTAGGSSQTNRGNRVTLSASEREMASMMGMTDQEYGRNKLALQKEGKLH